MSTDMKRVGRILIVVTSILTFESPAPAATLSGGGLARHLREMTSTLEDMPVAEVADGASKPVIRPRIASSQVSDDSDKNEKKLTSAMKKMFKDFRPGSCKPSSRREPTRSWPSRGETAISVCRP